MKKRLSVITSFLLSFCLTVSAAVTELNPNPPRPHPYDNSMSENSLNPSRNFGVQFLDIEGDFRATFGTGGRDENRDAILAYTGLSTVGAKTGSVKPSSLILQPIKDANGEPIEDLQDKTGYLAYYVGRDGVADMLIPNLITMIEKYAVFFNGNADYLKERILPKVEATPLYNQMPTNDYPELGSPGFGTRDMFIKVEGKLFFNIAYLHTLSGAGNSTAIVNTLPEREEQRDKWGILLERESDKSYYSQQMKSWQIETTYWPQIKNLTVLENGDVTYTTEIYGANGNSGKVDLLANFQENKVKMPSAELDSLSEYWRKMKFAYYQNLVDSQSSSNPFRNYLKELEAIPYTSQSVQTVTKTIPAAEVQSIIDSSRSDNNITLYVTDMFGRYISQTINYQPIVIPNLKVVSVTVSPNPLQQGETGTATVVVKNESDKSVTTLVTFIADGNEMKSQSVTLNPGEQKTLTFTINVPEKNTVYVKASINPNRNAPVEESTFSDNTKDRTVPAEAKKPVNPKGTPGSGNLRPIVPSGQWDLKYSKEININVDIANGGYYDPETDKEYSISSWAKIKVSYPGYSKTFEPEFTTKSPGKRVRVSVPTPQYEAFKTKYNSPFPQNAYLDINVDVEVNPDRDLDETTYDDNKTSGKVRVFWSKTKLLPND